MKILLTLQLTIFLLVAVGFLMKKIHIIGPQGQKNINDLVIYLILPCNILHAFTQSAADGNFIKYLEILLISIGIQVFCVIYGKVMFRKEPEGRYKCLQYGTICSNAGFLGNPIAEGIYGAEGLVLASVYLILPPAAKSMDESEDPMIWRFDGRRYLTIQMRSDISFLYNLLIDVLLIYMLQSVSVNNDSVLSCLQQF